MKVRLESLGCRLNSGEMEEVARELRCRGHHVVGPDEPADLCVLNSCAVTAVAARTSRHALRRLRRAYPDATLVATGCLAQLEPAELDTLGVDLVVGNEDKGRLPGILADLDLLAAPSAPEIPPRRPASLPGGGSRTRAFLKVQDGCDLRCTYCVVTVARGASRSLQADAVVDRVRELRSLGFREVVLCGVHLGSYGFDRGDRGGLECLVRRLLDETDLPRLRLSSLEPWDLGPRFFELLAEPRLLPHLHLPLQSGSDSVLRRMGRRSDRASYARTVAAARAVRPDVAISTDIMVGFPGEHPSDFEESLEFVERMAFSRLHVFRFSPRRGTVAAGLPGQVPQAVTRQRSRRMIDLGRRLEHAYGRRFVGRTVTVLWEDSASGDAGLRWRGLSDHYLRVGADTPAGTELGNQVTGARIRAVMDGELVGEVLTPA